MDKNQQGLYLFLSFLLMSTLFTQTQAVTYGGVDIWRVLLMATGIVLVFLSRALNGNPLFFYLCGIFIGVFACFMALGYYLRRQLPKKIQKYGVLISKWIAGAYLFLNFCKNFQTYLFLFALILSIVSFLMCNLAGLRRPLRTQTSKNLNTWTLRALGILMIFCSNQYQVASLAVILSLLGVKYSPLAIINKIRRYWYRKFPPKPRLLTSEEYYEEGIRATKMALEDLRKYCSSPDCAQWKIMLKLNDSKRFAGFVDGNYHLNDDEIADYEAYAFSLRRNWNCTTEHHGSRNTEISDNNSDGDNDTDLDDDYVNYYYNCSLPEETNLSNYGREYFLALLSLNDEIISIYMTMNTLIRERLSTWLSKFEDIRNE